MRKTIVMVLFGQLEDTIFDIYCSKAAREKILLCHISSAQTGVMKSLLCLWVTLTLLDRLCLSLTLDVLCQLLVTGCLFTLQMSQILLILLNFYIVTANEKWLHLFLAPCPQNGYECLSWNRRRQKSSLLKTWSVIISCSRSRAIYKINTA